MKELFDRCLAAKYIHTAEGGDYAIKYAANTHIPQHSKILITEGGKIKC